MCKYARVAKSTSQGQGDATASGRSLGASYKLGTHGQICAGKLLCKHILCGRTFLLTLWNCAYAQQGFTKAAWFTKFETCVEQNRKAAHTMYAKLNVRVQIANEPNYDKRINDGLEPPFH